MCELHRVACAYCGRSVCNAELDAESRRCVTCVQLAAVSDPPEAVVTAALAAAGGEPQASRRWRMAPGKSPLVVGGELGRKRPAVGTVRHDGHRAHRVVP